MYKQMISDRQWSLVSPCVESTPNRGRPLSPDRPVFEGILYVILHQIGWLGLPEEYPSFMTCFRRYNTWLKNGSWEAATSALFDDFAARTGVDLGRAWKNYLIYGDHDYPVNIEIPEYLKVDPENNLVILLFINTLASAIREETRRDFATIAPLALSVAKSTTPVGEGVVV
jgi:transposase